MYTVHTYNKYFPEEFSYTFDWIYRNKVLSGYSSLEFLEKVFKGMSRRIRKGEILLSAVDIVKKNYEYLEENSLKEFLNVKEQSINRFLNR